MYTNPCNVLLKSSLGLLMLSGLLLWSDVAASYTMNRTSSGKAVIWCQASVVVYLDTTHVKNVAGVADAVRSAFATWNSYGVPTRVKLVLSPKRLPFDSNDNKNVIRWDTGEWKWASYRVAKTVWRAGANSGCIKEADIILNAKAFKWGVVSKNKNTKTVFDVENVVAHEVGHFFGLDHSQQGDATMYATTPLGEIAKRTLSQDDLNGIVYVVKEHNERYSIYGGSPDSSAGGLAGESDQLGGCSIGGATPPASVLLLLALLGIRRRFTLRLNR